MAHKYVTLDAFAERLAIEDISIDWPKAIAHISEYCQALAANSCEYFFMRGVEGYLAGRHSPPVYKNEKWAQLAWKDGHEFAKGYLTQINRHSFHSFNRCWLEAYQRSDFEVVLDSDMMKNEENYWSAVFGLYARLHAHKTFKGRCISRFLHAERGKFIRAHTGTQDSFHLQKGTKPMAQQLYKDAKTGVIGIRVGEDDEGKTVLKTDKGFEAFDEVKKVIPHTIRVRNQNGSCTHFRAPKDTYKKGDILLCYASSTGPFMLSVRETDTERADASELKPETVVKFLHKVSRKK